VAEPVSLFCSYRLGLAIIAFLCFVFNYAQRIGMLVAIVCMVNHTAIDLLEADQQTNVTNTSLASREVGEVCLANLGNKSGGVEVRQHKLSIDLSKTE
jgi:hypothetical protein